MTSEWLDVARYSDTYDYQVDRDRFVWPYRDWVLRAFRDQSTPFPPPSGPAQRLAQGPTPKENS
jgi:hypothetical protein